MNYNTQLRKLLSTFFAEQQDKHFTIDELQAVIIDVSKSALYRNINQMVDDGFVRRFRESGSRKALYQYISNPECNHHFHLKCLECGQILHMNEADSGKLTELVNSQISFTMDTNKTMLFGYCNICK